MKLLILGGSPRHRGGVEVFMERATRALQQNTDWDVRCEYAHSAFARARDLPYIAARLLALTSTIRRSDVVWIQYVNIIDLVYAVWCSFWGASIYISPHLGRNWRSIQSKGLRKFASYALRKATAILLLSPSQKEDIAIPETSRIRYVRTLLPELLLGALERDDDSEPIRLLHAGRLSEGKGTFRFIEVCRELTQRGVKFKAVIAGGAPTDVMDRIGAEVVSAGMETNVSIVGPLSEEKMIDALLKSDALVHLSTVDSFPLIVLEALASGVFPICLNLSGAAYMVDKYGGAVVEHERSVASSVSIIEKLDAKTTRRQMQPASLRVRNDYAWKEIAALITAAIEENNTNSENEMR